jgi:hypothetical protein
MRAELRLITHHATSNILPTARVGHLDRWCRPDARQLDPLGFSFAPVWLDLLLLAFRAYLFGRVGSDRENLAAHRCSHLF